MFACLLFKTKLIFMPHGGGFLLDAPRALPLHPPIRLPGSPLSLALSCSQGTFPKGFFPSQTLSQISSVATFVLCQLGSRNFSLPVLVLLPCELTFLFTVLFQFLGDLGRWPEAARRMLQPHQTHMGSPPSCGLAQHPAPVLPPGGGDPGWVPPGWEAFKSLFHSTFPPTSQKRGLTFFQLETLQISSAPREGQAFHGGQCFEM